MTELSAKPSAGFKFQGSQACLSDVAQRLLSVKGNTGTEKAGMSLHVTDVLPQLIHVSVGDVLSGVFKETGTALILHLALLPLIWAHRVAQ